MEPWTITDFRAHGPRGADRKPAERAQRGPKRLGSPGNFQGQYYGQLDASEK
jgi:hypothetical protein